MYISAYVYYLLVSLGGQVNRTRTWLDLNPEARPLGHSGHCQIVMSLRGNSIESSSTTIRHRTSASYMIVVFHHHRPNCLASVVSCHKCLPSRAIFPNGRMAEARSRPPLVAAYTHSIACIIVRFPIHVLHNQA